MPRPVDSLRVEAVGKGEFDAFTAATITNDLTTPSEAAFEIGDDGTWDELEDFVAMGSAYQVKLNDRVILTGRIELRNIRGDAGGGSTVRMTVRTKLADAMYCSANTNLAVKDVTLMDWLVRLYEPLGYTRADFVFKGNVARELITGKPSRQVREPPQAPERIQEQQAKVQAPEAIFQAADRHLRRFGLMHWDSPDGRIVVSAPDDEQEPTYYLRYFRGAEGAENNLLDFERAQDFSGIPTVVTVHGKQYDEDGFFFKDTKGQVKDDDLLTAGFFRPLTVFGQQMGTDALALAAARRELSARSQRKDAYEASADGLSYWDGTRVVNWAPDTVADVVAETSGGAVGPYYVTRTQLERRPDSGDLARLTLLKRGVWRLS